MDGWDTRSAFYCFVKLWMQDRNGQDSDYQIRGIWYLSPDPIPMFQILTEHYYGASQKFFKTKVHDEGKENKGEGPAPGGRSGPTRQGGFRGVAKRV